MKTLIQSIKQLVQWFATFGKRRTFKKIDQKLAKAINDREVDRIILKSQIIKAVRKYLNLDAESKYIPKDIKNKEEIRNKVLTDFGEKMQKLNIRLNQNLKICDF
jgi:hypothetical protein